MKTIQSLASEAINHFEQFDRGEAKNLWRVRDGAPEWVSELCDAALGEMRTDDPRWRFIAEALIEFEASDDPLEVYPTADIYTHQLTSWLASRADRCAYCDDYISELEACGAAMPSMLSILGGGQRRERLEIFDALRSFLGRMVEGDSKEQSDHESA